MAPGGWWLALLLLLLSAPAARATHIVGGEMDLQYLRGDTYQLTLNLYFDAVNGSPGALDNELMAGIFDKATNRLMTRMTLPLISNTFVNYSNPACAVGSLSTRQLVYRTTLNLPAGTYSGAQGYYAAVERCCRNITIGNIVSPGAAAQTFYLEFPAVVRNGQTFRDSTPRIFPPLADYACLGELFTYDFGGQDPDGDSLVYDLVTPLNGHASAAVPSPLPQSAPYALVNWAAGLGTLNQIPGSPALTIGARSGRLSVRPSRTGLFVFGVRCQEFRGGQKIGETRRDFQLQVLACPRNNAPSLALLPGTTGSITYRPGRDTLRLMPGGPRCVRLRFTDPDPSSQLTLSLRNVDYTGALPTFTSTSTMTGTVHQAGQPDTLVATLCFSDCANTNGQVRHLDLLVADNGCSLPKRDTVHLAFTAVQPPNAAPTLTSTAGPTLPLHVRVGQVLTFDLTATDADADPLTFTTSGGLGATLTADAQAGTQRVAHFRWPITCQAVNTPPGQVSTLVFGVSSTSACGDRQTAAEVRVPVVVDYSNAPPTLTTSFPPDSASGSPPLVRVRLGQTYTATLAGLDTDRDVLALSAAGQNFDLAAAGMRLTTTASPAGQAAGIFTWQPTCDVSTVVNGQAQQLSVTFQLQESTCQPKPQTRTIRFEVVNPDTAAFIPPNIILPAGDNVANRVFTMSSLPPDFCDSRFAEIRIFSRWGRLVYQSADRNFHWPGEGAGGLYYYLLTYTTGRRYKGWVEVMQ